MKPEETAPSTGSEDPHLEGVSHDPPPTRRDAVRRVAKMAFVVPVVSTFFASQAHAVASGNQSCYPAGVSCDIHNTAEPCCSGNCSDNGTPGVDPADTVDDVCL